MRGKEEGCQVEGVSGGDGRRGTVVERDGKDRMPEELKRLIVMI